ncbi:autotransporter domain-containing protein [Actinobacillus equuli subsp. equuli]|uniref:Autotransporter domain-containing protein n=1 Tax=Actinobacillus equuli subsp. equuli TaxID=202947 RepID=A0A9X4JC79_ACTEU|nr:autotransporter domain-containing protein [Actinobacillus equuli]MDE8034542.1 autotransporter domain-containing protein [Actinobacillus equuli subsp. equuli]MDG4947591.1 autotransporter domain-containing protein [Actinobacillus equuli subsp. haemolyticus]
MKSKSLVVAMATMLALSTEADASKLASELATTARYYPSATNSYNKYSSMYSGYYTNNNNRNYYSSWFDPTRYRGAITRTVTTKINGVVVTKIYTTVNGRTTVRVIITDGKPTVVNKPTTPTTRPVIDTKPVVTPTQPVTDKQPVESPVQPVVDKKPVETPTQPVVRTPVENPSQPIVDTKPVVETPTQPIVDTKPVREPEPPISDTGPIIIRPSKPIATRSPVVASNVPTRGEQWNDRSRGYNLRDPNNKANVTLDGSGVIVGILDSGFKNYLMANDIEKKFGHRAEIIETGRSAPSSATHGIMVAEMVGGGTSNNGVAPKAKLLLADITRTTANGSGLLASASFYNDLWNRGARIFNQSYGIPKPLTYFNNDSRSMYYYERQFDSSILNIYKNKVKDGGLFIWAAGNNRGDKDPSVQAGLPHYMPELEKGWISVVALATRSSNSLGNFEWSNLLPYSQAGVAKNWTVSAMGDYVFNLRGSNVVSSGSSFAAPAVTGTAALVKQKYPWMDGNLIKQSILTTATDIGVRGVDDVYGWGLLNVEKATNGPARFDKGLAFADNVTVNIPNGRYEFSNDIDGNAGLVKNGKGELVLSGASTFEGVTTLNEGAITINGKKYASKVNVGNRGTLVANSTTLENGVNNEGTFVNQGYSTINNNYIASAQSTLVSDLGSNLNVKGEVDLNNSTLALTAEKDGKAQYVTAKGVTTSAITSDTAIKGNFSAIETSGLLNAMAVKTSENEISATVSRKNVADYVNKTTSGEAMWENVAMALENSFTTLDSQIEENKGTTTATNDSFAQQAAVLQNSIANANTQSVVLDSLSGQIYASAQALTFENAETVNKDLSNRLVMLGALDNIGNTAGVWVTGIYGNGTLKEAGFGEGKTNTYAGQLGFDKQFTDDVILGAALNYSKADVSFNRYGGSSKADGIGASLYARVGNKHKTPWYVQGRVGYGSVDSDVERNIILADNNVSTAKINHRDKVLSAYVESGYDFKIGNLAFTPFVGLNHDVVRRGAFSEENSQFGLTADKATYKQTSGLVGLRTSLDVNVAGMKTTLQGYVNHQKAFNDEDLSFKASYTGLQDAKFDVKGIGLAKSKTWVGVGALTEVNKNTSLYVNYDLKLTKSKGHNNVVTAGVRVTF